jgi:hypothetical protein
MFCLAKHKVLIGKNHSYFVAKIADRQAQNRRCDTANRPPPGCGFAPHEDLPPHPVAI